MSPERIHESGYNFNHGLKYVTSCRLLFFKTWTPILPEVEVFEPDKDQIFGHLDVCFMNWQHYNLHFMAKVWICMLFVVELKNAIILLFLVSFWSGRCRPVRWPLVINYLRQYIQWSFARNHKCMYSNRFNKTTRYFSNSVEMWTNSSCYPTAGPYPTAKFLN